MAAPMIGKLLIRLGSMINTEEGRRQLLCIVLTPIIIISLALNLVTYIVNQPFSALKDIFGENASYAESIWGKFNEETDTGFVYYNQYDKTWAKETYSGGTIGSHGCGPTSFAMIVSTFTQDRKYNPSYIAKWFTKQKYADPTSGTIWCYDKAAPAISSVLKSDGKEVDLKCVLKTSSFNAMKSKMEENQGSSLTIARVQGGNWTRNTGHFVVIRGFDENGKVYVADPASAIKSQRVHEVADVKDYAAQYWVITGPMFAYGGGGDGTYAWPVPGVKKISSKFGMRRHPVTGVYKLHDGIDIPAPSGTPIIASVGGTVSTASFQGAWGNCVTVKSGNGIMCRYAHMSKMAVKVGDVVAQGTIVGYVGTTGYSTGNHLHFGIYMNGSAVDPQKYIGKDTGLGESGNTGGTGGSLIGTYKATFYCPKSCCNGKWAGVTASGKPPTPGRTIAVDPKRIKLGTKMRLEFVDSRLSKYNGTYYAEDTGGDIKGSRIDVLTKTHTECNQAGVGDVKIYVFK